MTFKDSGLLIYLHRQATRKTHSDIKEITLSIKAATRWQHCAMTPFSLTSINYISAHISQ